MKIAKALSAIALVAAIGSTLAALPAPVVYAQAPPLHILASNAVRTVMEDVKPRYEQATGQPLIIKFDPSAIIRMSIEAGDAFDVVIVATDLLDIVEKGGAIAPSSRADIARATVGVGVRAGQAKPDVATPEAMKKVLLGSKAIAFTKDGAAVPFVTGMLDRLGIASQMSAKIIQGPTTTESASHVVDGSADLLFTMVSEILPIPGIQLAGPLPEAFPRHLVFSAGIGAKSPHAPAAAALIKFLTTPAVAPTLKAKGMEPVAK